VLSGKGEYVVDAAGTTRSIGAGDIVVARTGDVHGLLNTGDVPFVFISLVTPSDAGHERL
jgi:quercetin dioxygenase-like cupin family protein